MKFTITQQEALQEFISKADAHGCVAKSEWTTGHGRFTRQRVLPAFVHEIDRGEICLPNKNAYLCAAAAASFVLEENRRKSALLVLDRPAMFAFFYECSRNQSITY